MANANYAYTDDKGNVYSFRQDVAIASAVGNSAATVGTSKRPRGLKMRRLAVRQSYTTIDVPPRTAFRYQHIHYGAQLFAGKTFGDTIAISAAQNPQNDGSWLVIDLIDEKNAGRTAY